MSRPKADPVERWLDGYTELDTDQQDRAYEVIRLMRRSTQTQVPPTQKRTRKPKDAPSGTPTP